MQPSVFTKMADYWFVNQASLLAKQAGGPLELLELAARVKSNGAYETYAWLASLPIVKKWIGEKKAKELGDYSYTLKNLPFYTAVDVDRNHIRDDQVGAYETAIRLLPQRVYEFWSSMIRTLLLNGTSAKAFDDIAFFSNATGERTIDNLLSGSGIDTLAHITTDIETAITTMMAFEDSEGEVLNIVPDTFVVPPAAMFKFETAIASAADPSQTNAAVRNPLQKYNFRVITDGGLAGDNSWYALCTRGLLKPFIHQEREGIRGVVDTIRVKSTRMLQYSAEWDGNAGYGLPHLAIKMYNT